ncbi:MAG: glutamate racemase [Prevotellaceae bacterium]|jgi:glutamate racemase|nr:glutamate racemase [Prevotellaceae bacterium]
MIGIFDSGVGGISVWKELYALMPNEDFVYVADSAHCPYGRKSADEIIERAKKISDFLIGKNADIIVVACNTATAAAIKYLRSHFSIPFVGMQPAIKPAAVESKSGIIGVLATAGTFKGTLYMNTITKFAANIKVIEQTGDGLVELVENGKISGDEAEQILHKYINPIIAAGADKLVLGCTHYPFLIETIKKITNNALAIINPAPAVALQTKKILYENNISNKNNSGSNTFFSTGNTETMKMLVQNINKNINDTNFITHDI